MSHRRQRGFAHGLGKFLNNLLYRLLLDLDRKRPPFTLMNNLLEYLYRYLLIKLSFGHTMFAAALLVGRWHDKDYLARNRTSRVLCS